MIDVIINALGGRVLLFAAAGLLLLSMGLSVAFEVQSSRLDTARAEKQVDKTRLQVAGGQIAAQNAAVDQMLRNAQVQADRLHAAEAAASQAQVVTQERIQYVDRAAIPTVCPDAVAWGVNHAVEIGKRWEQGEQ